MGVSAKFRVAQGGCVLAPDNSTMLRPGDSISPDVFGAKWIEDAVRNGTVEPIVGGFTGDPGHRHGSFTPPAIGGMDRNTNVRTAAQSPAPKTMQVQSNKPGAIDMTSQPKKGMMPGTLGAPISKWNVDPSALGDKSLTELNIMVQERDSTIPAFTTTHEAVAFLSQDFGKTQ